MHLQAHILDWNRSLLLLGVRNGHRLLLLPADSYFAHPPPLGVRNGHRLLQWLNTDAHLAQPPRLGVRHRHRWLLWLNTDAHLAHPTHPPLLRNRQRLLLLLLLRIDAHLAHPPVLHLLVDVYVHVHRRWSSGAARAQPPLLLNLLVAGLLSSAAAAAGAHLAQPPLLLNMLVRVDLLLVLHLKKVRMLRANLNVAPPPQCRWLESGGVLIDVQRLRGLMGYLVASRS
mmetsp:Transcript_23644/g.55932  ORF Transcript_23644/g.55932 Transcript_23644/m.55932 type:complete len:228 (-) Transcript_23644:973-1656(-)